MRRILLQRTRFLDLECDWILCVRTRSSGGHSSTLMHKLRQRLGWPLVEHHLLHLDAVMDASILGTQALAHILLLVELDRRLKALSSPLRRVHESGLGASACTEIVLPMSRLGRLSTAATRVLGLRSVAHLLQVLVQQKENVAALLLLWRLFVRDAAVIATAASGMKILLTQLLFCILLAHFNNYISI